MGEVDISSRKKDAHVVDHISLILVLQILLQGNLVTGENLVFSVLTIQG